MTREQAIIVLNMVEAHGLADEAKRIAIEALEQEPCEDAISRQAAIDAANKVIERDTSGNNDVVNAMIAWSAYIKSLPSVNPQYTEEEMQKMQDLEQAEIEKAYELGKAVQPKTGHWIETAEEYYKAVNEYGGGVNKNTPYFVDDIACSECLAMYNVIDNETERFDHCPSCGARMVEPQESEE